MSHRSTVLFSILTVRIVFHAVFRTLGNLDWLVNKLIFHSSGMFYYDSLNRNNFPLPLLLLLKYTGRNRTMINIIALSLNSFLNLQMDTPKISFRVTK